MNLDDLTTQREQLVSQIAELDEKILTIKTQRRDILLDELRSMGYTINPQQATRAPRKRGRPGGWKPTQANLDAMQEGRRRARAARQQEV